MKEDDVYEPGSGPISRISESGKWVVRVPRYPENAPQKVTWAEFQVAVAFSMFGSLITWTCPVHANQMLGRVIDLWRRKESFWTCSELAVLSVCRMVKTKILRPTDVLLLVQRAGVCPWEEIKIDNDGEFVDPWPEQDETMEMDFGLRYQGGHFPEEQAYFRDLDLERLRQQEEGSP